MSKPVLIAMHGLPRSGKSTIVNRLRRELGAPVVRRDAIRLALHGHRFLAAAEPMVKTLSTFMTRALFEAGHRVVICDETNVSRKARESLKDPAWDVVFYPVLTDVEECKQRARSTQQEDLIPVIDEMAGRFEHLGPDEKLYWGYKEEVKAEVVRDTSVAPVDPQILGQLVHTVDPLIQVTP